MSEYFNKKKKKERQEGAQPQQVHENGKRDGAAKKRGNTQTKGTCETDCEGSQSEKRGV